MGVLNSVTDWLGLSSPNAPGTQAPGEGGAGWTNAQQNGHASDVYGGLGYDSVSGNVVDPYTDAAVNGPNLSQLGARQNADALGALGQQQGVIGQLQGTLGQQDQLLGQEQNILASPNSSLAAMQLQQGLGQAQAQQQAMVSGATGANLALAQRNAAQQSAQLAAQNNNQAAMQRVAEQQAAIQGQGSLLSSIAGERGQLSSQLGQQYLGGQQLASQDASGVAGNQLTNQTNRNNALGNFVGSLGTAAKGAGALAAG